MSRAEGGPFWIKPLKSAYTPPLIISKQPEGSAGIWISNRWKQKNIYFMMATAIILFPSGGSMSKEYVVWIRGLIFKQELWVTLQPTLLLFSFSVGGCSWSGKSGNHFTHWRSWLEKVFLNWILDDLVLLWNPNFLRKGYLDITRQRHCSQCCSGKNLKGVC